MIHFSHLFAKVAHSQSPKNVGNLGTGFLRKVSKSEEGLRRLSRINVTKTDGKGYEAKKLPHYMSQKDYRKDSHMRLPLNIMRLN